MEKHIHQALAPALLAVGLFGAALLLPWLELKTSRIALGSPLYIGWPGIVLLLLALLLLWTRYKLVVFSLWVGLWALFSVQLCQASLQNQLETARVGFGAGFWLSLLAFYIAAFTLKNTLWKILPILGLVILAFGSFSPFVEWQEWRDTFSTELWRHLALASSALLLALLLGLPLGVVAASRMDWVLGVTGFVQTIPSLALFGLLLPLLAWAGQAISLPVLLLGLLVFAIGACFKLRIWLFFLTPLLLLAVTLLGVWLTQALGPDPLTLSTNLQTAGVRGIGTAPAVLALTLYALLPITLNTYTALKNIPANLKDAGLGMGMNPAQLFWRTELPLALPLVFQGIRSAASLTLGITTIAALIGAGGLGFFILRGIEAGALDMVLLGAIPVIGLALLAEGLLRLLGERLKRGFGV
jgi:osmoprotectant transport system permease protein